MLDAQGRNTLFLKPPGVGRDAVIMPGVTIGDGAIVGARAVVASDVAWWDWPIDAITEHLPTIWAGTPAELEQAAGLVG